ncbi:probable RNA-dependent RNA polymerase 1 isoform X1 [Varroa jacobsoni]|uniref:probable RNA-dependent RNA polymerase 1 isoform X1 n=1 Tax=Varroa jacobsoni TaxID=62625 RepID=UPI000BF481CD|nr:probable RNA-dependent RNA polymerase 1 isoform X1 [Varroa jacobsoni]XP_022694555.1 probable RNA-dependent RNA polymerase 1 isoform X1 [Varroa jacobsoni]XP_022694556.1 probable RNA-dependent RNA polymerase 1 isoform X1 [Varroa jacobsoni]
MTVAGTVYVRRVFVTPTRLILRFPNLHTQNRILRHFDSEFAIRVSFRDDNLDKLTFSVLSMRDKLQFLNHVVGSHIRNGITIGGRRYMYVAASSSQLRDHGVWFYASDLAGFDAASIRQWMGDFSNISNVATRVARMGQCFSSTQETVEVPPAEELHEDDIWHPDSVHPISQQPYCFSDGCGKISPELLQEVWNSLPHITAQRPSALQIRYRGCKGMVCLDPRLQGRQLVLRRSMVKFECLSNRKLEVIKWSAPMNMFLNRPLIAILEHHGIKADVFVRLELEMIIAMADSLVCEASALRVLTNFVKTPIPFGGLAEMGWQLVHDPFFTAMLFDLLKTALLGLKDKANIAIPANEGRNMLGVVDETGILEYGQVFIQYTEIPYIDIAAARSCIVKGDVVITKCPCLHPGDVRHLVAVDVPELRHIRDCVVFPSRGKAPHPFEMSGSDLDGDEYICIWKPELIFTNNVEPHLYEDKSTHGGAAFQRPVHEVSFLCSYIANDMIGIISNAHLAWADQSGLLSDMCLALVDKASKALDFAKTGQSVDLHPNEKPGKFPDFMEKGDHKHSYQSNKALGILYRTVRQIMSVNNTRLSQGQRFMPLEVPGWQMFRESAIVAVQRYNKRLADIMEQHGIMSEGEVFSGRIGTLNTFDTSRQEKASVAQLVERQKASLMEDTRELFTAELEEDWALLEARGAEQRRMLRLQKASAWFMAAYVLQQQQQQQQQSPEATPGTRSFYSFPWCIAHVILEAKCWLQQTFPSMRTVHELSESRDNILVRVVDERLGLLSAVTSHQRVRAHLTEWLSQLWRRQSEPLAQNTIESIRNDGVVDSIGGTSGKSVCADCFGQIYNSFAETVALPRQLMSVGEYLVAFLEFVACGRCEYPTSCPNSSCTRLFSSDCPLLTVEASKVYVRFAIDKDPCFLGLPCVQGVHRVNNVIVDAPAEKVNISEKFFQFLAEDGGRACSKLLSCWTGVQHISIRMYHRHQPTTHSRGRAAKGQQIGNSVKEDGRGHTLLGGACCSMKVHYCGTDAQIFAMQQVLRSDNLETALIEKKPELLNKEELKLAVIGLGRPVLATHCATRNCLADPHSSAAALPCILIDTSERRRSSSRQMARKQ